MYTGKKNMVVFCGNIPLGGRNHKLAVYCGNLKGNKYGNLQMNKLQNDLLLEYTGKQLLKKGEGSVALLFWQST